MVSLRPLDLTFRRAQGAGEQTGDASEHLISKRQRCYTLQQGLPVAAVSSSVDVRPISGCLSVETCSLGQWSSRIRYDLSSVNFRGVPTQELHTRRELMPPDGLVTWSMGLSRTADHLADCTGSVDLQVAPSP